MTELNRIPRGSEELALRGYDGARALVGARGACVHLTIESMLPVGLDAVVHEQDTAGVLCGADRLDPPRSSYRRLIAAMLSQRPARPGAVVVREGRPLRMHAIVHDLDCDPSWSAAAIAAALELIVGAARERALASLALPPLGAMHGRFPVPEFVALLRAALARNAVPSLRDLWLYADAAQLPALHAALRAPG
ncbi:MAG: hypothetical protein AB7Q97_16105 [Gammaproteobacteria bacterium]